jgi:hypothetical protein
VPLASLKVSSAIDEPSDHCGILLPPRTPPPLPPPPPPPLLPPPGVLPPLPLPLPLPLLVLAALPRRIGDADPFSIDTTV